MYGGPHSIYGRFARVAPASPVLGQQPPPPPPNPPQLPHFPTQPNGSTADAVDKFPRPECAPGVDFRSSSNLNALESTITVLYNCVVFS